MKSSSSDVDDGEYINASYITGYYNRVEFIATQAPLSSTVGDFWRMILERGVQTLVTLGPVTQEQVSDHLLIIIISVKLI